MFTLRFAFKNIISRKSSLVIILFITFSIALLVVANAVFDGTGNGIEKTFSASFTGDIVVRPETDFPMSLFGDETPVTGQLSELPRLTPYQHVLDFVKSLPEIKDYCPQLSSQSGLGIQGAYVPSVLFAVNSKQYLNIMSGIKITEGTPFGDGEKGIMISTAMKKKMAEQYGIDAKLGEMVQLISSNGSTLTIRAVPVTAIYEYNVENELLENISIIDPDTLRSLLGIESLSTTAKIEESESLLIDSFDSVEDMFAEDAVFETDDSSENEEEIPVVVETDENATQTTWNYIVCKVNDLVNVKSTIRKMNKFFKQNEWPVTAISWRAAAGMAAQYIYWMRLIFNIGLILLIGTGFIVVNNTLVIAALDRTKETGALRAIGADRKFIGLEYLYETLLLTITAGILGCALGVFFNQIIVNAHVTFSNTYLIQLFGGTTLETKVTLSNILSGMGLSLLLAIIGWLYPVHIALDTSPVAAMEAIK